MKFFIAFACLVASISAVPYSEKVAIDFNDERLVTGAIVSAIEDASQAIKDAGLDPLYIKREASQYSLPVPTIFNYAAFIEEVLSTGLSNIKVNRMSYNVLTSRLNFDIELPRIDFAIGAAQTRAVVFSNDFSGQVSGKVGIDTLRFKGYFRINIGIISGISVRSVDMSFTLNGIDSDIRLVIQGVNYSEPINRFLGATIPNTIKDHYKEINKLLEIVLKDLINENL